MVSAGNFHGQPLAISLDFLAIALAELGILVFKTNYYSQKLTSETENNEAKKDLANSLASFGLNIKFVAEQMISMETPKYARLEMEHDEAIELIKSWI